MIATFYFTLEYTSPGKWATRRNTLLLSLVTLGLMLLIATNDLHHLLWIRLWFDRVVRVERGPLNFLLLAWAILLPTLSVLLFLRLSLRSRGVYRRQALMLFVGAALPLLTFFLEPAGINPLAPLDPVILMWNVSSLLYTLAIFRFHMLEVVPIGRDTAIERMTNGVLILDADDRIVDLNPAAGEVLALSRGATVGRPAGQALAAYPDLSRLLEQKTAATADHPARDKSAEVLSGAGFPLTHPGGFHMGRLILLQDVTEQHCAQAQMQYRKSHYEPSRVRECYPLLNELSELGLGLFGRAGMQSEAATMCSRTRCCSWRRSSVAMCASAVVVSMSVLGCGKSSQAPARCKMRRVRPFWPVVGRRRLRLRNRFTVVVGPRQPRHIVGVKETGRIAAGDLGDGSAELAQARRRRTVLFDLRQIGRELADLGAGGRVGVEEGRQLL